MPTFGDDYVVEVALAALRDCYMESMERHHKGLEAHELLRAEFGLSNAQTLQEAARHVAQEIGVDPPSWAIPEEVGDAHKALAGQTALCEAG